MIRQTILLACAVLWLFPLVSIAEVLEGGGFTIDFEPIDRPIAQDTLHFLEEARAELEDQLPLGNELVHVRIAGSMNEFLGLSGTYAHVGVSGVTRADQSLIALKSPRLRSISDDYRGTVRHELVHVLLHRNTDTRRLPRWLNEGLCMMLANELRWGSSVQVARMYLGGELIPLRSMDRAFTVPGTDHQFGNAYAQALSMTRHLRDELGDEAFWAMVVAFRDAEFGEAIMAHGGMSPQEFWESYKGSLWGLTILSIARTGSFWGGVSMLCVLAFLARRWRNRAIVQRWAAEENDSDEDEPFDWDNHLVDGDDWKQG